ncbi:hypothetical protein [Spirosoma pulveris]
MTSTITTDSIPRTHPLFKLFKHHELYISYLTSRYSSIDYASIFNPDVSFAQADRAFRQALSSDTLLNRCFPETASYYLNAQNTPVQGVSLSPKPALTMPILLGIAARFFDRLDAMPNNHVAWYLSLKGTPDYDGSEVRN